MDKEQVKRETRSLRITPATHEGYIVELQGGYGDQGQLMYAGSLIECTMFIQKFYTVEDKL